MYEASVSGENGEEFSIPNVYSGQKYEVSCNINYDHNEYIITISQKHEGKSNGEKVVDSSTVAQFDVYDLVVRYTHEALHEGVYPIFSLHYGRRMDEDSVSYIQGLIAEDITRVFAYALRASDIACLNVITSFKDADTEERKMILNNLHALSTVYNNVYHIPSGDKREEKLKFNKELSQMWEYFSLSLLHVQSTVSENKVSKGEKYHELL